MAVTSARLQALSENGEDEFHARLDALLHTPLASVVTYLQAGGYTGCCGRAHTNFQLSSRYIIESTPSNFDDAMINADVLSGRPSADSFYLHGSQTLE